MKYIFNDMGFQKEGLFVQVALGSPANIRIMDKENFDKFKKLEPHDFIGGYVKFTPYVVKLPRDAHWIVVVDLGGNEGKLSAAVSTYQKERQVKKTLIT